jgi:hypothetical protein
LQLLYPQPPHISSRTIFICLRSCVFICLWYSFGITITRISPCLEIVPTNFSISTNNVRMVNFMLYSLLYGTMFIYNTILYYIDKQIWQPKQLQNMMVSMDASL